VLETFLASAVFPALLDFVKGSAGAVSRKWFGLSVDDQIKLAQSDVTKLEALAKLDNPYGTPSQWVVDLRASFRYISAFVVIVIGAALLHMGSNPDVLSDDLVELGSNLVSIPFGFIFGERLMLAVKGERK
jgi:hypothetical protein